MKTFLSIPKGSSSPLIVSKKNSNISALYLTSQAGAITINAQGFMQQDKSKGAFLKGTTAMLSAYIADNKLVAGSEFPLDLEFIVEESTTPSYVGQKAKVNPTTGVACLHNGAPIYRSTKWVLSNSGATSTLLASDKATTQVSAPKAEVNPAFAQ